VDPGGQSGAASTEIPRRHHEEGAILNSFLVLRNKNLLSIQEYFCQEKVFQKGLDILPLLNAYRSAREERIRDQNAFLHRMGQPERCGESDQGDKGGIVAV
jgi:hypothetical protein